MADVYGSALADILNGTYADDYIYGYAGDDVLYGKAGHDRLYGDEGADTLYGGDGIDRLYGGDGDDTLDGGNGDDWLDGGSGSDTMSGGAGHDVYYVDSIADTVIEAANSGDDRIVSSVSYVLAAGANIETVEAASGLAALNLTGNEQANRLHGNDGDNVLDGGVGSDFLSGGFGNDTLIGGEGADTLICLTGADTAIGGTGNDIYSIGTTAATIVEVAGEGFDTVETNISFSLAAGVSVERIRITDLRAAVNLTGNEYDNTISGNAANNVLDGGAGNDRLFGSSGISGFAGGNDTLTGGDGSDVFIFNEAGSTFDQITDFTSGTDQIELRRSYFSGLALGTIDASMFVAGTAALDADDRILYDQTTGILSYDSDGIGSASALQIAVLQPGTILSHDDFWVSSSVGPI